MPEQMANIVIMDMEAYPYVNSKELLHIQYFAKATATALCPISFSGCIF